MPYRSPVSTTFLLYLCLDHLVGAVLNSVCDEPGYNSLRPCAQSCIGCNGSPDRIALVIGCGNEPPNECWCRTNLFALATSGFNSCISRHCSTIGGWEPDYTSALSFYTSYCQKSGFTAVADAPADVIATTTPVLEPTIVVAGESTATDIVIATKTSASNPTTTTKRVVNIDATSTTSADSRANEGNGSRLSLSDKIALGVGIGIGLPATIAALVSCCILIGRMG
jgi:hypothetical protein